MLVTIQKAESPEHRGKQSSWIKIYINCHLTEIGNSTVLTPPLPVAAPCPAMNCQARGRPRTPAHGPGRAHGGCRSCAAPASWEQNQAPSPQQGPDCGGSGGTEQHLPGQAGQKGSQKSNLKAVLAERKHFSVCTAGSSNEKKQKGQGKRREKGRSRFPKAAPPPGRSAGSRPLRGLRRSSTEQRLGVETVPVASCTQPAWEHTQQPRSPVPISAVQSKGGQTERANAPARYATLARWQGGEPRVLARLRAHVPAGWLVLPQGEAEGCEGRGSPPHLAGLVMMRAEKSKRFLLIFRRVLTSSSSSLTWIVRCSWSPTRFFSLVEHIWEYIFSPFSR